MFNQATHHSFGPQPVRDFLFHIKLRPSFFSVNGEKQTLTTLTQNNLLAPWLNSMSSPPMYDGASGDSVGGYFATHAQDPSNAIRSTARTAYYNLFVNRPSLYLLTSHQVTRVITESTHYGPKVTGVEVIIIFLPMVTSLSE
jgi:hypothetical protein